MAENQSAVLRAIAQHRAALLARERAVMARMTEHWMDLEAALEARIAALVYEIDTILEAGAIVNSSRLLQMERYQDLVAAIQAQIGGYSAGIVPILTQEQRDLLGLGIRHSVESIQAGMFEAGAEVPLAFNILPTVTLETMAGMAGPDFDAPLGALLREAWPDAVDGLTNALLQGVAMGQNPRTVARAMQDGMTDGLDRMMTIARTEMLRSYREATRQEYAQSGVVTGYRRIAAHNEDTCLACLALDGQEYPTDEMMELHPNCRCAMTAIVLDMPPVTWQSGQDWLAGQSEEVQRGVMGDGRYNLWAGGQVALRDMVTVTEDPTWGPTLGAVPLRDLQPVGEAAA